MSKAFKDKPGIKVREQACRVLLAVIHRHHALDDAIPAHSENLADVDRSLLQAISYGVMRWLPQLNAWKNLLVDRPAGQVDPTVEILILIGLYQLMHSRIPVHAAIHATVESAIQLRCGRAKGMINAVLRNFQRRQESLQDKIDQNIEARYAHPKWMLTMLQADWPNDWESIANANNRQAPMTLRIDAGRVDRDGYLKKLSTNGLSASKHDYADHALVLDEAASVQELPGFDEGLITVQDAAAQLAAPLLEHGPTHRVLDACAAPGGKTAHILQLGQPAHLDALDVSEARLNKLRQSLVRIRQQVDIIAGDAASPADWWNGQPYDRILLDAPCSASGVIRRHPDIKRHRSPKSLKKIVRRQSEILDALWPLLAPNGILLYVTCSIFKIENEHQVNAFLTRQSNAVLDPLDVPWGRGNLGRQVLPGEADMDGFYFARLIKKAT